MLQEAIKAQEFVVTQRPRRRSPAACGLQQLARLALLMMIGFCLISLSLNPSRALSATAAFEQTLGPA